MNKKSQKFAAIAIGFVLSVLLIYIGFRIVQKRGSQAGVAENYTCVRKSAVDAECTWNSNDQSRGTVLYASMPPEGIQKCNLVFIAEELTDPVAIGDGNFEHKVTLQPLVANQSYCSAPGGDEDRIVEVPKASAGDAGSVLLEATPSPSTPDVVDPQPTTPETLLPTSAPTSQPPQSLTTDDEIDAYYDGSNTGDDWGDCLTYFDNKGQQVSSNACIRGYYRHNATPTP